MPSPRRARAPWTGGSGILAGQAGLAGRAGATVLALWILYCPWAWAQEGVTSATYTEAIPTPPEQHLPSPRDAVPTSPGRLSSGGFKIVPRVGLDVTLDSNITRSSDAKSDIFTTYEAGLTVGYEDFLGRKRYPELRRDYFLVSLDLDRSEYLEHPEYDNTDWLASAEGGFLTPRGWSASFRDRLSATASPRGEVNDYGLGVAGLNRMSNLFEGRTEYEFVERWSAEVGVRHDYLDYAAFSSAWQNREDLEGWTALLWRALPKTQALLEARRKKTVFPDQQDQQENTAGLDAATSLDSETTCLLTGVRFAPLARIQGEAKIGVMRKEFDNPFTRDELPLEDIWRWVLETNLSWRLSEHDFVTLLAGRTVQETADLQYQYREETGARLRLWHNLSQRLLAEASAGFYHYDYEPLGPSAQREDELMKGQVGLKYNLRSWSNVGFYYSCDKLTSTLPDREYLRQLFEVRLGLTY